MLSPADELLLPAAERVSLALGGGLGAILAVERHHLRDLTHRVLFIRWRTWLITAPIFGAAVMWSRWGAVAFVAALSVQALREYAAMVGLPRALRLGLLGSALVAAPLAVVASQVWFALPAVAFVIATLVPLARGDVERGVRDLAATGFGFVYIPVALGFLLLIREHSGPGILLALGTAVAASDVFAFVAGRVAGRHRLAPAISPDKSLEGVAGNLVGAALGWALMSFALPADLSTAARILLPVMIGLGCVWGDLVESLLKRQYGVKDAGSWLPGFGGLLDRIDSLLIVLPVSYAMLVVLG